MNKSEFIERVAQATGQNKTNAAETVDGVLSTIVEVLREGQSLNIVGFGNFVVKHRPARVGRNPRTGEPANIAASNSPAFKPSKTFKDLLNP